MYLNYSLSFCCLVPAGGRVGYLLIEDILHAIYDMRSHLLFTDS